MFKVIFILLYTAKEIVKIVLNRMNYTHLKNHIGHIPPELESSIDKPKLMKIDGYNSDKMNFSLYSSLYSALLLAGFLFSPLFGELARVCESLPLPFQFRGVLFFMIPATIFSVLEIPFDYYSHFVIEQKHGFNRYTVPAWIIDNLKSFVLTTIFSLVLISALLTITGEEVNLSVTTVFMLWSALVLFAVIIIVLTPTLIMPLFYKLKPIEDQDLKNRIDEAVKKSGFQIKRIFQADESKKSSHANASFSGIGKAKTVVIFDTLIDNYSNSEITAVLAHEIGHGKKGHIRKMMVFSFVLILIFLLFASQLLSSDHLYSSMGFPKVLYAALFAAQIFFETALFFLKPLFNLLSRKNEYEADRYAVELTGEHEGMINFLRKISANELSNINPHPFYEKFYYSHPSVVKRIDAIKKLISSS